MFFGLCFVYGFWCFLVYEVKVIEGQIGGTARGKVLVVRLSVLEVNLSLALPIQYM